MKMHATPVQPAEIVPYVGPHDMVLQQLIEAQATGRVLRTQPLQQLDSGHVLVVAELRPETEITSVSSEPPARKIADWHVYFIAAGAVLATAAVGVVLFLLILGLKAVVLWGMANSLTIGAVAIVGFIAALVFMGALAKMRYSGHSVPRGYRQ